MARPQGDEGPPEGLRTRGPALRNPPRAIQTLRGLRCRWDAADSTVGLASALVEALRSFETDPRAERVRVKHIILLSDGVTLPGDFEGIVRTLESKHITVSTVYFGYDELNAPLMNRLAQWGGGRFQFAGSSKMLPALFIRDADQAIK